MPPLQLIYIQKQLPKQASLNMTNEQKIAFNPVAKRVAKKAITVNMAHYTELNITWWIDWVLGQINPRSLP